MCRGVDSCTPKKPSGMARQLRQFLRPKICITNYYFILQLQYDKEDTRPTYIDEVLILAFVDESQRGFSF